jgi:glycogen debranching enzyme
MRVTVLRLSESGQPVLSGDGQFLNLPIPYEPYILRFVIYSWSRVLHRGSLWCNVPPKNTPFDRNKYYEYRLTAPDDTKSFTNDIHVDIKITSSGPFSFYTTYMPALDNYFDSSDEPIMTSTKKFHFIVSSGFTLNGKPLDLNSLAIQTVLSKLMGPVSTWDPKLAAIKAKGYNMIHFTPLQHRGASNSPFSIFDQLAWDPDCFPGGEKDIAQLVQRMEHHYGVLSLTDVVLNHTAHNSEWLRHHPEAGYSIDTAPHLKPALDLDNQLMNFSSRLKQLGLPTVINSVSDLEQIMGSIREQVLDPAKLWEYYVVDVHSTVERVMGCVHNRALYEEVIPIAVPESARHNLKHLAQFVISHAAVNFDRFGEDRFLRRLDTPSFLAILKFLYEDTSIPHYEVQVRRIVDEINEPLYQQYDDEMASVISQIYNRVKYVRLDGDGPKLGPINEKHPLVETYFTRLTTVDGNDVALVNNGWVWAGDPLTDFASNKSRAYLRRDVIIWGDCVKLRYGEKFDDSPFLWDHMKKYAQLLAKHFHGFRIDNCHSTPIHVGEYLLDMARLVRPNLYVVAELFTGSEEMDKIFVERLGLTSLIREAMQAWSVQELSYLVNKHGGRPMGSFSKQPLVAHGGQWMAEEELFLLRASPIHAWFMDCTHDNKSAAEKRTVEDTLPSAALVAMCACAVGSTVGFDECYPHSLDVVNESRKYTFGGGISDVKKILYGAHLEMGQRRSDETYTHHEGQFITVHRVDPKSGTGYFLIARTKFHPDGPQTCKYESNQERNPKKSC